MIRFGRRLPATRQHDATDCGAACLHAIGRYFGSHLPIARIRQLSATGTHGTNVLGLVEGARAMGLTARGVRAAGEALERLPTPFIAHLVLASGLHHFVVVYRVTNRRIRVMDPAEGRLRWMAPAEFRAQWSGVAVLLAPGVGFLPQRLDTSPALRFWRLVQPHRTVMAQALVGAAVHTLIGLSTAIYVQKVVDHVLVDGNLNLLNLLSATLLLLLVAQLYLGVAKNVISLRVGQKIDAALILGYYRHLLRLPQPFFDSMRVGEIIARVNDAVKIRAFINDLSVDLMVSGMVVIFSLALMLVYDPRLTLVPLAALAAYGVLLQATNRLNRRFLRRAMEAGAELESQLVESVTTISTIKRLGLQGEAELRTERRFVRLLRPVYDSGLVWITSNVGSDFLARLAVLATFWIGAGYAVQGRLTPGELMSFYALVGYLTGPATTLVTANRTIQDALIAGERLFEILDLEAEAEAETGRGGVELPRGRSVGVVLDEVTFGYGTRPPVLHELSLEAPPGQITAIIGESGSGKSTVLALIQRQYHPRSGRIRIGGFDVAHIDSGSLRNRVVAVPQEVHLFAGTVIENIAPGELRPDMVRLLEVCEEVGVSSFAEELPEGYATLIGENGAALSGGQRQRLALARALYRRPAALLLDEATSNLDSATEAKVRSALRRARREGVTVLVVAHRLSSVADADQLLVMRQGRIAEQGTFEELLCREGEFTRLWHEQHPVGAMGGPVAK